MAHLLSLKSLYTNNPNEPKHPDWFNEEIQKFLELEGFVFTKNDSYSFSQITYEKLYKRFVPEISGWSITIYISKDYIGIDKDYDCGGNFMTYSWMILNSNDGFMEAYNEMILHLKEYF